MPGIDGAELTRLFKQRYAPAPAVAVISASEWSAIEEDAHRSGVDKFLTKPLFHTAIAEMVNECLTAGGVSGAEDGGKSAGAFAGYRLLLAEDVELNREIVTSLLEPTCLEIDCAENGAIALRMFAESPEKYDMIFMDVQMPEMDGYEATCRIRGLGIPYAREIPIVAMTANVFREDIEQCLSAGMNDHVGKPLNLDEVLGKLRKYLRSGHDTRPLATAAKAI